MSVKSSSDSQRSSSSRRSRNSLSSASWRSRSAATPTAALSTVSGIGALSSISSPSALSTLPPSPLRNEIRRRPSSVSTLSTMSVSSGKRRDRDDDPPPLVASPVLETDPPSASLSAVETAMVSSPSSYKKARMDEGDNAIVTTSPIQSPTLTPKASADASVPGARGWLGSIRSNKQKIPLPTASSSSVMEPSTDAASPPESTPEVASMDVDLSHESDSLPLIDNKSSSSPPLAIPTSSVANSSPPSFSVSASPGYLNGIASWFIASNDNPAPNATSDPVASPTPDTTAAAAVASEQSSSSAHPSATSGSLDALLEPLSYPSQSSTSSDTTASESKTQQPISTPIQTPNNTAEAQTSLVPTDVPTTQEPADLPPSAVGWFGTSTSWWGVLGYTSEPPASSAEPPNDSTSSSIEPPNPSTSFDVSLSSSDPPEQAASITSKEDAPLSPSDTSPTLLVPNSDPNVLSPTAWLTSWVGWSSAAPAVAPSKETEVQAPNDSSAEISAVMDMEAQPPSPKPELEAAEAPASSPSEPSQMDSSHVLNEETRASWLYFFSSRSRANFKAITDAPHSPLEEMEVMDIDEEASADKPATPSIPLTKPIPITPNNPSPDPTRNSTPTPKSPATPLTNSKNVKKKTSDARRSSVSSSKSNPSASKPKMPNLVLPTWGDTFYTAPRDRPPPPRLRLPSTTSPRQRRGSVSDGGSSGGGALGFTKKVVSRLLGPSTPAAPPPPLIVYPPEMVAYQQERRKRYLNASVPLSSGSESDVEDGRVSKSTTSRRKRAGSVSDEEDEEEIMRRAERKRSEVILRNVGKDLPRVWGVLGEDRKMGEELKAFKKIMVIGVHGWFPGVLMRTVMGEPTGTSVKFADMMTASIQDYVKSHGVDLNEIQITKVPLEGEGNIGTRVDKLFLNLISNAEWMNDLHEADAIFVATHSQGCVVSTQLIDRLIGGGYIFTGLNAGQVSHEANVHKRSPRMVPQRVCMLGLCGVHHGPLSWLNTSTVVNPYITYFESSAAKELFEFQDSESAVSKAYASSVKQVLHHGVKMVYIASLNDQVVPIYSAAFTSAQHPLILRALYMDGDAYSETDFLSNFLILLLRIRNAGLDDGGLLTYLSEATAGSLSGVGHSSAYEESATYTLAVRFLFEASGSLGRSELALEPFQARAARNDYTIPWALRGLIEDARVAALFSAELSELRAAFDKWQPKTAILRDVRRKLEPIRLAPKVNVAVRVESEDEAARSMNSKL